MTWIKRRRALDPSCAMGICGPPLINIKRCGAPAAIVTALLSLTNRGETPCAKRSFCSRSAA